MDIPEGSDIKCRRCMKASGEIFVLGPVSEVQNGDHGGETQGSMPAYQGPVHASHFLAYLCTLMFSRHRSVQFSLEGFWNFFFSWKVLPLDLHMVILSWLLDFHLNDPLSRVFLDLCSSQSLHVALLILPWCEIIMV